MSLDILTVESPYQKARRPHRLLVEPDDVECYDLYLKAVAAGTDPREQEICWPLCFRVTQVECPYGPGEPHIDCALFMECSCKNPDDDEQYDGSADFTYKFNLDRPVGDPDRYVRVWAEGATPEGIALQLAYELAMDDYEDKHGGQPGWEQVDPPQCWVQYMPDGVEEALEEALGELRPGWHSAYVDNDGSIDESILVLEIVIPEHAKGCNGIDPCSP